MKKKITDSGVFLFIPKKKKNADRAEGSPNVNVVQLPLSL